MGTQLEVLLLTPSVAEAEEALSVRTSVPVKLLSNGAELVTLIEQVACGATERHWLTSAVKRDGLGPAKAAARVRVVVPVLVTTTVAMPVLFGSALVGRKLVMERLPGAGGLVAKDGPEPAAVPVRRMY